MKRQIQNEQNYGKQEIFKISKPEKLQKKWTLDQISVICKLYEEHGPSWVFFSQVIKDRSYTALKNKYTNGLRRISKLLNQCEGELYKNIKKTINCQMLSSMIDFINQIHKILKSSGLTVNYESKLFEFRAKIVKLSMGGQQFLEELPDIVRLIKFINSKIRCFGIFKVKNRRTWKISKTVLLTIKKFDNIFQQEYISDQAYKQLPEETSRENQKQSNSQSYSQLQISEFETQFYKPTKYRFEKQNEELQKLTIQILGQI